MATLEDVAAMAGVSRATVSRVINGESKVREKTKQLVEKAIADLGYTPNLAAKALASSKSHTLGLVTTSYLGAFFGSLMDNVQSEAESHHKQLLVMKGRGSAENELNAIHKLYNMNCDGLILHVRAINDEQILELDAQGREFTLLDRLVEGIGNKCISFDHHHASQLATHHCIDKGHTKIACISGPTSRSSSQRRRQGFLDTMDNEGLIPTHCLEGEYDLPSGYQLTCQILKSKATAIYCCNEEMAVGALLAISEHGLRVPNDISVICYDSGERANFVTPKLTSLHFPINAMARDATRRLVVPDSPIKTNIPTIIDRGSVRCLS
ncbi:LacI family transcriptional regulator [Vibrio sp. S4M6]|uniref:LacI family DNA-binding transcriptional regulator n=1 Tax=Vibrio sinus TaxID=2946865 RepID=UPI002029EEE5|nr:LacI family DNA-binding transcriptional regulator [Vibrio sinus]MCL9781137.1 LacI family transcriptional regulator [Vibrio sinus]